MIIGITGTNGAGKGTVVEYLVKEKGFKHYSARELILTEIKRRGIHFDRNALREVGNDLRLTHGAAYVIKTLYNQAVRVGGNALLESVRAVSEVNFLRENGAVLLAVNADRPLRYQRSVARGSETDKVDFGTWVEQEEAEWHNEAAHDMNVPAVMGMADATLHNDGTHEELFTQIDAALEKLGGTHAD